MNLSSDLISQFAKITNDNEQRSTEEQILYGEIVQFGDELCVKFDGSNQMTPAVTTSTIKVGDRVSAVVKNHTAIITGNLSDPSAGSGKVAMEINQKVGVIFTGLADGTTVINGGCIQTGTIDAKHLNLSGAIKFTDLSDELQIDIDDASDAYDIAKAIATGKTTNKINATFIDGNKIISPIIEGEYVKARTAFQVAPMGTYADGSNVEVPCGAMGVAFGLGFDEFGNATVTTYGVAMASSNTTVDQYGFITTESNGQYVIVTDKGVRLQAGQNNITVTNNGAFYNGVEIGSGAGNITVTAVWG